MNNQDRRSIERALLELADVRRAIAWAQGASRPCMSSGSPALHRYILIALASCSGAWTAAELSGRPSATWLLYASHYASYEFRLAIALLTAMLLLFGAGVLYFVLWRVARREGENLSSYVERNFAYLRVLSFGSDLFLKFIATAAVILAGRGDWVAPLLMIFTGDYLLQGRVFILPLRGALVFGLGCFVLGVVQLLWLEGSLVYPLSVFCAACLLSLLHSSRAAGVLPQEDDCVGGQHD
jgi:hypothetical protein